MEHTEHETIQIAYFHTCDACGGDVEPDNCVCAKCKARGRGKEGDHWLDREVGTLADRFALRF